MTASPTVPVAVTFSRWNGVPTHTSLGSSEPDHSTTLFPLKRCSSTTQPPAACINGARSKRVLGLGSDALDELLLPM